MEPQGNVSQELRAMKKTLCFISIIVCAVCLACTAATFTLLCRKDFSKESIGAASAQTVQVTQKEPYSANQILLWQENYKLNGMKYQNGNLTILTKGLYYIYCHLHFIIEECFDYEDLHMILNVNNKPRHQVFHTIIQQSNCTVRMYRDQYLGLQLYLNAYDNVSIETNHVTWLNRNYLPDDILFGAFKLNNWSAR
ncbi:tumor necrosis factor ligand superfamily member 8 isoform X2 [Xenopus tropicalis]|uniref:Tumor necrosis factor ligand superfamily member 8 isoform X2 n=1 Tax=Xenopus tropicalis TaxID=8364 RepID=A0A8J1IQU4_XENTR|nr:tumor necrosis factor ligand superfamily member 8 isoform X2 [Xenopus tropicalis]